MMLLRSAPASPFARKARIAAAVLGLADRVTIVPADTSNPDPDLLRQNPLGKIPALELESGETVYDSRVILACLDEIAGGGRLVPAAGPARIAAMRLEALADGLMDAAILQMYEARWRPEDRREPRWLAHQAGKVARALEAAEAMAPSLPETPDIGTIALACALGYLDLRFSGRWRDAHPALVAWLDRFAAAVPSFEETRFRG